jgi:hypothetical protein
VGQGWRVWTKTVLSKMSHSTVRIWLWQLLTWVGPVTSRFICHKYNWMVATKCNLVIVTFHEGIYVSGQVSIPHTFATLTFLSFSNQNFTHGLFVSLVYCTKGTVRWFVVREKHCWMTADSADKSKRTGCQSLFRYTPNFKFLHSSSHQNLDICMEH